MQFGDKIRAARISAGKTQKEVADAVGLTTRTIQLYEANDRQPKNAATIVSLAGALGVETDFFLSASELERMRAQDAFLAEAADKYGSRGRAQAQLLLEQTSALFAGGELTDEDKEAFFRTISEIYFDAKRRSQKYSAGKKNG